MKRVSKSYKFVIALIVFCGLIALKIIVVDKSQKLEQAENPESTQPGQHSEFRFINDQPVPVAER